MVRKNTTVMQYNSPNKKPPTDKEEITEKIVVGIMLIGGCCGSGYIGQKTYRETRNKSFDDCVAWTSLMTVYGFIVGAGLMLVVPVVAPIAIVIGTIRYFDHTSVLDYDRGFMEYTLHTRKDT